MPERSMAFRWADPSIGLRAMPTMTGIDYLRAMLAGELPGPPIAGNAYEQLPPRELYWRDTLAAFMRSEFVAEAFGSDFRHIYGHIRKLIQSFGQFIYAIFQATQMCAHESKVRVLFQHVIPCVNLILIRRILRMQIHMIFRMLFEIFPVAIYSHLFNG